ncbi:hypothetical protein HMPREF1125_0760 [Streptococcus oralis SK304]|uniref:Uncharacterized protein n=1 Tax=Streptococcus oralis SK304 TaxID=1161421 RepID=J4TE89_STROR|nr:hypothetical protein HMPREF1125_0760 [Streptococcus oralis SK304]
MHHIRFFLPPQDTKDVKSKVKIGKLTLEFLVLGNFIFFTQLLGHVQFYL